MSWGPTARNSAGRSRKRLSEGIWVEYLWPHPESRKEQQKVTWSVRHDGLIFSSGYYAGGTGGRYPGVAGRRPARIHRGVREPRH